MILRYGHQECTTALSDTKPKDFGAPIDAVLKCHASPSALSDKNSYPSRLDLFDQQSYLLTMAREGMLEIEEFLELTKQIHTSLNFQMPPPPGHADPCPPPLLLLLCDSG